jgi:hypothetical protein
MGDDETRRESDGAKAEEDEKDEPRLEEGRTPPPEKLEEDPAYEPKGPLRGYKGG